MNCTIQWEMQRLIIILYPLMKADHSAGSPSAVTSSWRLVQNLRSSSPRRACLAILADACALWCLHMRTTRARFAISGRKDHLSSVAVSQRELQSIEKESPGRNQTGRSSARDIVSQVGPRVCLTVPAAIKHSRMAICLTRPTSANSAKNCDGLCIKMGVTDLPLVSCLGFTPKCAKGPFNQFPPVAIVLAYGSHLRA